MSDITPSKWSAWSAAAGATPVDFGTRPCGICGERVRVTLSGAWREYHDCKPVPLARLQQAERERDEARAALAVERQHRDGHLPSCAGIDREEGRCGCGYLDGTAYRDMTARMEQATALLREWREDDGLPAATHTSKRGRTDAFLAGQPAPAKVAVDDAMVERALSAYLRYAVDARAGMRAALVAALEGRT